MASITWQPVARHQLYSSPEKDLPAVKTRSCRGTIPRTYPTRFYDNATFNRYPPIKPSLQVGKVVPRKRLLTFDGGGVRGLCSLLILREIMEEIGRRTDSEEPPRPSQYFDLIGGTSTGGLIALMLGRLGMVFSRKNTLVNSASRSMIVLRSISPFPKRCLTSTRC